MVFTSATFFITIAGNKLPDRFAIDSKSEQSVALNGSLLEESEQTLASFQDTDLSDTPGFSLDNIISATKEVENLLEWIIMQLKSFVHELDFSVLNFDKQAEKLSRSLTEICNWADSFLGTDEGILRRINFAKYMIQVMGNASSYLKFVYYRDTCLYLTRRITQLNVRLLTLHNSQGIPDPSIEGYEVSVSSFLRILESWKALFENLTPTPSLFFSLVFDTEYSKAASTLQTLKNYTVTAAKACPEFRNEFEQPQNSLGATFY